jgi:phosphoribosylanthranilate isomerase
MSVIVKICGITNFDDAINAVESGADMLGFVFYPKSKRYIEPEKAAEIIREVSSFATCVGVFVNENIERIKEIIEITMIDLVQLSGDETIQMCLELKNFIPVMKSFKVTDSFSLDELSGFKVDYIHLDSYTDGLYGGTGKKFNWENAIGLDKFGKIILAGGLNPENVKEQLQ